MINTKLKTQRYNGWTNKDTFLFSRCIDDAEHFAAFKSVVKVSNYVAGIEYKRKKLIEIFLKLKTKEVIKLDQVDFFEIVSAYKNQSLETVVDSRYSNMKKRFTVVQDLDTDFE